MMLIGIGGGLGAISRYALGLWVGKKNGFPVATLLINITGSFVLGYLAGQYDYGNLPEWLWAFLGVGFLGGYTTFSTFGHESITLFLNKKYMMAIFYILFSVLFSVLAAYAGYQIQ